MSHEREAEHCNLLKSAGWEPVERSGKTVWRNPKSGYLYPQDVALRLVLQANEQARCQERKGG